MSGCRLTICGSLHSHARPNYHPVPHLCLDPPSPPPICSSPSLRAAPWGLGVVLARGRGVVGAGAGYRPLAPYLTACLVPQRGCAPGRPRNRVLPIQTPGPPPPRAPPSACPRTHQRPATNSSTLPLPPAYIPAPPAIYSTPLRVLLQSSGGVSSTMFHHREFKDIEAGVKIMANCPVTHTAKSPSLPRFRRAPSPSW